MAQLSFHTTHSESDEEVLLLLGITSILQFDFEEDAVIYFQTDRNLEHLINKFYWKTRPKAGQNPAAQNDTQLILSESGLELLSRNGKEYIPKHLLKSELMSEAITISKAWVIARTIHEKSFSNAAPKKRIAFVYTNEVKEWISLLEANESLIARWYRQRDWETDLVLIDLTKGVQPDLVGKTAFTCDPVVIAKISPTTSQFIKSLRSINPDIQLILHAFESPSVYFVNTFLAGLNDYLYETDLWLMSCKADEKLAQESWIKIRTKVFPLKVPDTFLNTKVNTELKNVLYFGRISEQKNLHEAIVAVSLVADKFREKNRKFKIFGYEDYLGMPHHRIPSQGYLEMLYKLAKDLKITDIVEFHPAVAQEKINDYLQEGIFLSPSVHSDENFGLVAFRALNLGIPVILSDWGGHKDFVQSFSHVHFIPVSQNRIPHINPVQLANKLLEVWDSKGPEKKPFKWEKVLFPEGKTRSLLRPGNLKIQIEKRVEDTHPWQQRRWPLYGRIFQSFNDPLYRLACKLYGAVEYKRPIPEKTLVSPFVKFSEGEIKILDCMTGVLRYPRRDNSPNIQLKQLGNDSFVHVSLSEWEWLWENGHVYSRGEL